MMRSAIRAVVCLTGSLLFFAACSPAPEVSFGEPEVIASGYEFTEGPHWLDDGRLLFSDIPANRVYQWDASSSETSVFVDSSGRSNGIAEMPDGTLILAQHAGRVSRLMDSGDMVAVVTEYQGKRLNSPNDVAIRSDSLIYFTDPPFGVSDAERELDVAGVYRVGGDGEAIQLYDAFRLPNGIAFSPDESYLYVNDTETGDIMRFEVTEEGDLENGIRFASVGASDDTGAADGMVTDDAGRLYTTGPGGITVLNNEGDEVGRLSLDQRATNLAWGGENGTTLFITSPSEVLRVEVTTGNNDES
ncbi:SMP-30/gluconolactonase/LRE family protein [Longibacter sp.]|uniref:SMP-30/gluconolactonase/LRE family protein n=1 Tax=Longibacter sp. TaxID=2045415 RepID=UPI003EB8A934